MTAPKPLDSATINRMLTASREAQSRSYSPYSHFPVGASVLCSDGTLYQGCNVENAGYSSTICAERVAMSKAVSEGQTSFRAVLITSNLEDYIAPCGVCRQFMVEFGKDIEICMTKKDNTYKTLTLEQLLPLSFGPEDLLGNKSKKKAK